MVNPESAKEESAHLTLKDVVSKYDTSRMIHLHGDDTVWCQTLY